MADVGDILTIQSLGTWTNSPTGYVLQWRRDSAAIPGASGMSYVTTNDDVDKDVVAFVRGTNSDGFGEAVSNAIRVLATATSTRPWLPTDIPTGELLAWYDGQDGAATSMTLSGSDVTQWKDKSSNARHLSQFAGAGTPNREIADAVSGNPCVVWSDTDGLKTAAPFVYDEAANSGGVRMLAGIRAINSNTNGNIIGEYTTAANNPTYAILNASNTANSQRARVYIRNDAGTVLVNGYAPTDLWLNDTWRLIHVNDTGSLVTLEADANDTVRSSSGFTRTAISRTHLNVGAVQRTSVSPCIPFRLADLVFVKGTISPDNLERLEGFIMHRIGRASALPAGHPYKTAPPTVGTSGGGSGTVTPPGGGGGSGTYGLRASPVVAYSAPDTSATDIPADALDLAAYGGNIENWLTACIAQDKPGKVGSGTYNVTTYTRRPPKGIYGYGPTKPKFVGNGSGCWFYLDTTNFTLRGVELEGFRYLVAGIRNVDVFGSDNGKPWGFSSFNASYRTHLQSPTSAWTAGTGIETTHNSTTLPGPQIDMAHCVFRDCDVVYSWLGHKAKPGNLYLRDNKYFGTWCAVDIYCPWLPNDTIIDNCEFGPSGTRTQFGLGNYHALNTFVKFGNETTNEGTYVASRGGLTRDHIVDAQSQTFRASHCRMYGMTSINEEQDTNIAVCFDLRTMRGATEDAIVLEYLDIDGIKGLRGQEDSQALYFKADNVYVHHCRIRDTGASDQTGAGFGDGTEFAAMGFKTNTDARQSYNVRVEDNEIIGTPNNIPVVRFDESRGKLHFKRNKISGMIYTSHNPPALTNSMGVVRTYNRPGDDCQIMDNVFDVDVTPGAGTPKLINFHSQAPNTTLIVSGNVWQRSPGANSRVFRNPNGSGTFTNNKSSDGFNLTSGS